MSDPILTPITAAQAEAQGNKAVHESWPKRALIAIDQAADTIFLDGVPDETISSDLARRDEKGELIGKLGSAALDVFQKNHGVKAQAGDLARAEQVEAVEKSSGYLDK